MAFINNCTGPVFRFADGWLKMGAQFRPLDTRTAEQVNATIMALSERIPEVNAFIPEIKKMSLPDKRLVSDTLELANTHELTMTPVDMKKYRACDGKNIIQVLLEKYVKASKENPEAMRFSQAIIDNTDNQTGKFVLSSLAGFNPEEILYRENLISDVARFETKQQNFTTYKEYNDYLAKKIENFTNNLNTFAEALARKEAINSGLDFQKTHEYVSQRVAKLKNTNLIKNEYMKDTAIDDPETRKFFGMSIPFIRPVAESTINRGYLGDFQPQINFLKTMDTFFKPEATPEKLNIFEKFIEKLRKAGQPCKVDTTMIDSFILTKTPVQQMDNNIAVLPQIVELAKQSGKNINPTDFVMHNINLT